MIVAKIDRDEVLAPLHTLVLWVSLIGFAALLVLAAAGLILWHQQKRLQSLAFEVQKSQTDTLIRHFFELPFIGMAMISPTTKSWIRFNDQLCAILGYSREELSLKNWAEMTHPDDLEDDVAQFGRVLQGESEGYRIDKRFIRKDGEEVHTTLDVECVRTPDGRVDYFVATIEDITERLHKETEILATRNQLQATLDAMPDLLFEVGLDGFLYDYHSPHTDLLALPPEAFLGRRIAEVLPPDVAETIMAALLEADRLGFSAGRQYALNIAGAQRWFEISIARKLTADGQEPRFVMLARDITERKQAEIKIKRLTNFYAALSQCNQSIVHCKDEAELFTDICRDAVVFGQMKMAWIGVVDSESQEVRPVASFGDGSEYLQGIQISTDAGSPYGCGPTGTSIRDNQPFWCQDFMHDPATTPWHERDLCFSWGASAALPLHRNGIAIGAFTLYAAEANAFDKAAQNLLVEMSLDIDFALDNFDREAERKRIDEKLRDRERRLSNLFEQAGDGIFVITADHRYLDVNAEGLRMLGYSRDELQQLRLQDVLAPHERPRLVEEVPAMMEGTPHLAEWEHLRKDGSTFPAEVSARPLAGNQYLAIVRDLTQRKEAEARIQWLAHFDALTGLANRTLLNDRASHALGMAHSNGRHLAVLCLDLDHFKHINDTLGQRAGDAFLMEIGRRIGAIVRREDTVSRQGGDDFLLVLPDTDTEGVLPVLEKLLETVASPFQLDEHELVVTLSIGVAMYPTDGSDFETLAKHADVAMYRAKQSGRNTYRFFKEEMQMRSARTLLLENGLRRALGRDELRLLYQPLLSMDGTRVIGAEALLRWQSSSLGEVCPAEFIPAAEHSGQIIPIGEWVLRTAVRQMKAWLDTGLPPMTIAVNLSAVQFRHPNLPHLVTAILDEIGLPPHCLELELTEAVAMDNPMEAIQVMDNLHQHGIRMTIDDFGTGYSSLNYLKRFHVYKLKIDQSFVRDMAEDSEDRAIVSAVINLAKSLGLVTIAEGVETAGQLALLREMGCNEMQGYFFSEPLPAYQFKAFVAGREFG